MAGGTLASSADTGGRLFTKASSPSPARAPALAVFARKSRRVRGENMVVVLPGQRGGPRRGVRPRGNGKVRRPGTTPGGANGIMLAGRTCESQGRGGMGRAKQHGGQGEGGESPSRGKSGFPGPRGGGRACCPFL